MSEYGCCCFFGCTAGPQKLFGPVFDSAAVVALSTPPPPSLPLPKKNAIFFFDLDEETNVESGFEQPTTMPHSAAFGSTPSRERRSGLMLANNLE